MAGSRRVRTGLGAVEESKREVSNTSWDASDGGGEPRGVGQRDDVLQGEDVEYYNEVREQGVREGAYIIRRQGNAVKEAICELIFNRGRTATTGPAPRGIRKAGNPAMRRASQEQGRTSDKVLGFAMQRQDRV